MPRGIFRRDWEKFDTLMRNHGFSDMRTIFTASAISPTRKPMPSSAPRMRSIQVAMPICDIFRQHGMEFLLPYPENAGTEREINETVQDFFVQCIGLVAYHAPY